jgi:hypothetical protein
LIFRYDSELLSDLNGNNKAFVIKFIDV